MPHSLHEENYASFTSLSFFTVPFIPVCPEHLHTFELGETASRQAPFPPVMLWPCCIKLRQCVCICVPQQPASACSKHSASSHTTVTLPVFFLFSL